MAVMVGSARVDERGKYSRGQRGDQTKKEVSTQEWYLHKKGWYVIRANEAKVRKKIAEAMSAACANNNIGYSQSDRYSLINFVKTCKYNPAKCTAKVNTDCSALVRVCVCYAGIIIGDCNTSNIADVLVKTGKFKKLTDSRYTNSSDYLLAGDILVTKTKGHVVVVLNDGKLANQKLTKPKVAPMDNVKYGAKNNNVKLLQSDLNYTIGADIKVDGVFGDATKKALISFQKKNKLTESGKYDKATYNKMAALLK